jgi:hypothetical protein
MFSYNAYLFSFKIFINKIIIIHYPNFVQIKIFFLFDCFISNFLLKISSPFLHNTLNTHNLLIIIINKFFNILHENSIHLSLN